MVRTVAWVVLAGTIAGGVVGLVPGWAVWDVVLFPLVLLVVFWVLPFQIAWTQRRTSPIWTAEQSAVFDEGGITATGLGAAGVRGWASIRRVVATREFLLFYLAEGSGFFIPKRAFATPGDVAAVQWLAAEHGGGSEAAPAPALPELDGTDVVAAAEWTAEPGERYRVLRAISRHGREPGKKRIKAFLAILLLALYAAALAVLSASGPAVAWLGSRRWVAGAVHGRRAGVAVWPGGLRTVSSSGLAELGWDAFPSAVETTELFLFFIGGTQAVYLPKRFLGAREIDAVRAVVREKMGEKALLLG
ncbi:MAG TPA: YcxB family protein [Longimicrobiaceae bacterium]|nr:YcxB family protein [Longimicrobiaceae bacterium]